MDPKASAKSKRSHSLHGRRTHNPHHPPPATSTSQNKKKGNVNDPQQQGVEQRAQSHKPSLPSNWERYGEGDDDGEQEQTAAAAANPKPKSKGADFTYLVEQARSQPRDSVRSTPSFDDAVPDYIHSLSSFLSTRGNSLLLSCADDDFVVDDEVTSSFQVPFLSMDLHALVSQLEKLKLSQRLFFDAEYLEEELDTEQFDQSSTGENVCEKFSELVESKYGSMASKHVYKEGEFTDNDTNVAQAISEHFVASEMVGGDVSQASSAGGAKCSSILSSIEDDVNVTESRGSMPSSKPQSASGLMLDKSSGFEASTVEEELDMLLDSLSEIKLPDSSITEKSSYDLARKFEGYTSLLPLRHDTGTSSFSVSKQSLRHDLVSESNPPSSPFKEKKIGVGDHMPKEHAAATSFLDDTIDDLLMQTSMAMSDQGSSSLPEWKAGNRTVNISQALDDLDSLLDGL